MSRVGQQPIPIPEGVTVNIKNGGVSVAGPKGELKQKVRPEIKLVRKENLVLVSRNEDSKLGRSLHGLTRTLITNMIKGVTEGWSKTLKMVGTGYRAELKGGDLIFLVGFSHPVEVKAQEGIKFEVEGKDTIEISGIDKILVGQVAARIRKIRPPEPYKGKGIRYEGEEVRQKPGKAAKVDAAGFEPTGAE
jgi:large subunit ribosomal protein L6